jgi:hypothetical protein
MPVARPAGGGTLAGMTAVSNVEAWTERGARLHGDHEDFAKRFDQLCQTAHEGDWEDVDALWGPFETEFRAHMAFEEKELFDRFAASGEGPKDVVQTLRKQHDEMREQLAQLGVEIQLHAIRAETIDNFVKTIKMHATVESAHFYPWLDKQLDEALTHVPKGQGGVRSL